MIEDFRGCTADFWMSNKSQLSNQIVFLYKTNINYCFLLNKLPFNKLEGITLEYLQMIVLNLFSESK